MSEALIPLPLSSLAQAAAAPSSLRGRPPCRLLAAAAAGPALVHSIIVSRSSCAQADTIVSIAVPMGPGRVQALGQGTEPCSPFSDLLDKVPRRARCCVPIGRASNNEYVAGLQAIQGLGQLRTFGCGSADTFVDKGLHSLPQNSGIVQTSRDAKISEVPAQNWLMRLNVYSRRPIRPDVEAPRNDLEAHSSEKTRHPGHNRIIRRFIASSTSHL